MIATDPDPTYTLSGSAVIVDAGISVASADADITGVTETITNYQVGDVLSFTPLFGISDIYAAGVLTLYGSAPTFAYEAALHRSSSPPPVEWGRGTSTLSLSTPPRSQ